LILKRGVEPGPLAVFGGVHAAFGLRGVECWFLYGWEFCGRVVRGVMGCYVSGGEEAGCDGDGGGELHFGVMG